MTKIPSPYLEHLPEVLRSPSSATGESFLGEFLKVFEALLGGRDDAKAVGEEAESLAERLERYPTYLDPSQVPLDEPIDDVLSAEFLTYLASWVALTLDQNWEMDKKRIWLSRIVPLYKRRGTLSGIREYLKMFVGNQVTVEELDWMFIVGHWEGSDPATILSEDSIIGGAPAYFFRVRIDYASGVTSFDIADWGNLIKGTRAVVDMEKPAHTYYMLEARAPGFVVAASSTVADDTLIWEGWKVLP